MAAFPKRNAVAARLEPDLDTYIESGDGDARTAMLSEAIGEIDRLQDEINAMRGTPTDFVHYSGGRPPIP